MSSQWITLPAAVSRTGASYMSLWRAVSRKAITSRLNKDGKREVEVGSLSKYVEKRNATAEKMKMRTVD